AGAENDVSLRVEEAGSAVGGLVAERTLSFDYTSRGPLAPHWTGMHDQVGVGVASPTWFFGEGTTLDPFTEFLTIQNPDPSATTPSGRWRRPPSSSSPRAPASPASTSS